MFKNHWILLSNVSSDVGSHSKCVQYYDSLFNSSSKNDVTTSAHSYMFIFELSNKQLNCGCNELSSTKKKKKTFENFI